MQSSVVQRPAVLNRRCCVNPRADATARVRGDARRVQRWVSDCRHWTQFYPGTKKAIKIGNGQEPIRVGAKFELERELMGMRLPMSYEVLETDPGKRLVLSGISEHHTQMDQFFFMADRHDANFCAVRYITDIRLREWRSYLQPLATRYVSKVPEEAMSNLQKTLNCAHSPVFSADFEHTYRQEMRSTGSSRSGTGYSRNGSRGGTASSSSRNGTTSSSNGGSRSSSGGWSLRDLFGSGNKRAEAAAAASFSGGSSSEVVVLDPMGYYRLLGLSPQQEQVAEDEIKAAYRRLALQLHPDRHIGKDAAARAEAAQQFALLLKAYDTLKDPEQRALYNAGQLAEATLKL